MQAGHWVPRVTLAHRMTADQVAVALSVVRGPRVADGYAVGVRRWDGDARREWAAGGSRLRLPDQAVLAEVSLGLQAVDRAEGEGAGSSRPRLWQQARSVSS